MEEINIYDLLRFYRKQWLKIIGITIVGFAVAATYTTWVQKPLYKSQATLIAVGTANKSGGQTNAQLNNYTQLFTSRRVLDPVLSKQNKSLSYESLSSNVKATNDKDTELIRLSVSSGDAKSSQDLANGIIESFKKEVKTIYGTDNVDVIDSASLPSIAYNVKPTIQYALGAIAGFILSILALFFAFDFANSKTAKLSATEKLVYEKTERAKKAEELVLVLEKKALKARLKREKKAARAERWAMFFRNMSESRANRLERKMKIKAEKTRLKAEKIDKEASEKVYKLRSAEEYEKNKKHRLKKNQIEEEAEAQAQKNALNIAQKAELEAERALEQKIEEEKENKVKKKEKAHQKSKQKNEEKTKKAMLEAELISTAEEAESKAQEKVYKLRKTIKHSKTSSLKNFGNLTPIKSKNL